MKKIVEEYGLAVVQMMVGLSFTGLMGILLTVLTSA